MDKESLDYYHYQIMGNGDVWLNTGTPEEPEWERVLDMGEDWHRPFVESTPSATGSKWFTEKEDGIDLGAFGATWPELVKSRNFGYMDKLIRDLGNLKIEEATMQDKISYVCDSIRDMLLDKNESYGNSALDPVRIFSDADADEQLLVRIDDKLSRIMCGNEYVGDDDITDLIGYLILLKIAREQ